MPLSLSHSKSVLEIMCLQPLVLYICSVWECVCYSSHSQWEKHKTLNAELLFMILIWKYLAVGDVLNSNPILPAHILTWKSPCHCAWITVIKRFSRVCGTILRAQFICLRGTDNWNVKHTLFTENTAWDYFLCLRMMNVFPLAGRSAGCCIYAQDSACEVSGLIHDLVEGAAERRGGLQPSNYNMDTMLTVMHAAAVFLICQIYYCLGKYRIAVSGLDIG